MKQKFIAIAFMFIVSLLILSGCHKDDTAMIVSENSVDINGNGKNETLVVRMVDGKYYEDKEPGPYMGWKWEGTYIIELIDPKGKIISTFNLNEAFSNHTMIFMKTFDIQFRDYNNDGKADFTIGQYASSNGYVYKLFSISESGVITILPIENSSAVFAYNGGYSPKFEKADDTTFKIRFYDNAVGKHFESHFQWRHDQFVKVKSIER